MPLSSPAPLVSSVSSIMIIMLAFELTVSEITDNISLDFTDKDLILNWNSTGKRNKTPTSLVGANCCVFQAACFDLSVSSLRSCALPLFTDVPVNLGDT